MGSPFVLPLGEFINRCLYKGINIMTTNYADLIQLVKTALKDSDKAESTLKKMGKNVAEFYGSESALNEVKAQFMADAILPVIDKRHAEALAKDIPRKGSKEYNALGESGLALWESVNQAKKDARSTIGVYFKRVISYAFPSEKTEGEEKAQVSDVTKDIELLNGLIKRLEKAESRPYDLAQVINNLKVTLALIHE
jgi:hypothetical protein